MPPSAGWKAVLAYQEFEEGARRRITESKNLTRFKDLLRRGKDGIYKTYRAGVIWAIVGAILLNLLYAIVIPPIKHKIDKLSPWYDEPDLKINITKIPPELVDYVKNEMRKKSFIAYPFTVSEEVIYFVIENVGEIEANDVEIILHTNGIVIEEPIFDSTKCAGCSLEPYHLVTYIDENNRAISLDDSFCSVVLRFESIKPGGRFSGSLFVDTDTEKYPKRSSRCGTKEGYSVAYSYQDSGGINYFENHGDFIIAKLAE